MKKMKGILPERTDGVLDEFTHRYKYGHSNGDIFWQFLQYLSDDVEMGVADEHQLGVL